MAFSTREFGRAFLHSPPSYDQGSSDQQACATFRVFFLKVVIQPLWVSNTGADPRVALFLRYSARIVHNPRDEVYHWYRGICLLCFCNAIRPTQCFLYHFQLEPFLHCNSWVLLAEGKALSIRDYSHDLCLFGNHTNEHGLVWAYWDFWSNIYAWSVDCTGCMRWTKFHLCSQPEAACSRLLSDTV